jgi:hypothetical protein
MKRPSGRVLLLIGTIVTLVSGVLLLIDGSTRATSGGPYGFLDGAFALALLPGVVLLGACWLLFSREPKPGLAGLLGVTGAIISIPLALAGFWVGFALVVIGSFLVLRNTAGVEAGRSASPTPSSHSFRSNSGTPWLAPLGVALVGLVAIVLLCPQTIPADAVVTADITNDPIAYDLQAAYVGYSGGTSISYEVNAISQNGNCALGYGYFVNGYLEAGGQAYWYQVGLSDDWGGGTFGASGWALAFEVFGPDGGSLFPSPYGGAGTAQFSGPVSSGDAVVLTLAISGNTVSMTGTDSSTHASASESYSAEGASQFGGGMASQNPGYFTGLLTECYTSSSVSTALVSATYSDQAGSQTEAGVLVEEIDFSWGRLPFLPSLELPEMHTDFTLVGPTPTDYEAYGLTLAYSSSTFSAGSD